MKRKTSKSRTTILLVIAILSACSSDEETKIAGVDYYSGSYRLTYVSNSPSCTNSTSTNNSTSSINDLEISSNGRFKKKVYSLNSNNECEVSEILEGKITIEGSYYERPYGFIEYDNSDVVDDIDMDRSINGIHFGLIISERNSSVQYRYYRSSVN